MRSSVLGMIRTRGLTKDFARGDRTVRVVLTTHYMDEADAMAERVIVVDHGRVIADDTADRLKADLAGTGSSSPRGRRDGSPSWRGGCGRGR